MPKAGLDVAPRAQAHPYDNYFEYLSDEFARLDLILEAYCLQRQETFGRSDPQATDLFVSPSYIASLFSGASPGAHREGRLAKEIEELSSVMEARLSLTEHRAQSFPLERCVRLFALSDLEKRILLLALASLIDSKYEKIYAYLHNYIELKLPSRQIVYDLFCNDLGSIGELSSLFSQSGALVYWSLIYFPGEDLFSASYSFTVEPRVASFLLGNDIGAIEGREYLSLAQQPVSLEELHTSEETRRTLFSLLTAFREQPDELDSYLFFFCGPGESLKYKSALALISESGLSMIAVDTQYVLGGLARKENKLRMIIREAVLTNSALFFTNAEQGEFDPKSLHDFYALLVNESLHNRLPIFLSIPQAGDIPKSLVYQFYHITFTLPDYKIRKEIWKLYNEGRLNLPEGLVDDFAGRYKFTEEQVFGAVEYARKRSVARGEGAVASEDLREGCRVQSNTKLSAMGSILESGFSMDDIVLPRTLYDQLYELIHQYTCQYQVFQEWGFARKYPYGRGITVLFSGHSGTGKTMAASVVANELGLYLYKIDLSSVVSKYIGETEKNLSRIFQEASTSNAILFFDEADAIFGKRTEVKDSHDRYANIEVSYLLQKMEEYDGITILATNLKKNIDDAFLRRIRFLLEFPFPAETYRKEIWQKVFPANAPLSDSIDYDFLAQKLDVTGGLIKNIALSAAFLASAEKTEIGMRQIVSAAKREFIKEGKTFVASEMRPYAELTKGGQGV